MISVNVSAKQLLRQDFVDKLKETLIEVDLPSSLLCLEITESTVIHPVSLTMKLLDDIVRLGVKIAIDDFGTGYSSLSMLKQLPIASIKIDQSFVRDMTLDSEDASIVQAVIGMGEKLRMELVAEGVETLEQCRLLLDYGCHIAQGYYLGKPVPAEELKEVRFHHSSK